MLEESESIHAQLPSEPTQRRALAILTDDNRNFQPLSDAIVRRQCRRDARGGQAVPPRGDVYIAPDGRLHMTPQTIGGLHARDLDPAAQRVPLGNCTTDGIAAIDQQ